MRIEGTQPNQGISGENAGGAKASPKAGGSSFGEALRKAAASRSRSADAPAVPVPGPAGSPAASQPGSQSAQTAARPAEEGALSPADHLEMIRFRMKTGYYNSKTLDDALTDKLTGFFDDLT